ncbi:MAG: FG-GAP repeat protein [Planctomycetota bacterium]
MKPALATTAALGLSLATTGPLHAQCPEPSKLNDDTPVPAGFFGASVSVSGTTAVVGANGDELVGVKIGAAHFFENQGGVWMNTSTVVPFDAAPSQNFGNAVSISGNNALIGANADDEGGSFAGAAYLFERPFDGAPWLQRAKFLHPAPENADFFGNALSLSGNTAAVGASGDDGVGSVSVFELELGDWQYETTLVPSDGQENDAFGIAVGASGDTLLIGSPNDDDWVDNSGSVYVFEDDGAGWVQTAKLRASDPHYNDGFGSAVAVSGDVALISAWGYDGAGADSGAVYVFERQGGEWVETATLIASDASEDDGFGRSVAISGTTALIGATRTDGVAGADIGAAYLFEELGGTWVETSRIEAFDAAEDDGFGNAVALAGTTALVGVSGADDGASNAGAVYVCPVATPKVLPLSGCGLNPTGSLTVIDGEPALASTLVLGIHNPLGTQALGSPTFLALSAGLDAGVAAGGCGTLLGGWSMLGFGGAGELLLDPFGPLAQAPGFPWNGAPAPVAVPIPDDCAMLNMSLHAQGLLLDLTPAAVAPIGLTEGLRLQIGI